MHKRESRIDMTYTVTLYTYTGMAIPVAKGVSRGEALSRVRRRLKRARSLGCPVAKISDGKWEIETPESACMISDEEGILVMRRHLDGKHRAYVGKHHRSH